MNAFTQSIEQLKELNFLNTAYKCFFTAEEVEDIKTDYKSIVNAINYCSCCNEEVKESQIIYNHNQEPIHSMCGNFLTEPTFEEYVILDAK